MTNVSDTITYTKQNRKIILKLVVMTRINDKDIQPESLKEINDRIKKIGNEFPMERFYNLKSKWQMF